MFLLAAGLHCVAQLFNPLHGQQSGETLTAADTDAGTDMNISTGMAAQRCGAQLDDLDVRELPRPDCSQD